MATDLAADSNSHNSNYTRYFGNGRPLWWNPPGGEWRVHLSQFCQRAGASCFFRGLALVCPDQNQTEHTIGQLSNDPDTLQAAVTFNMALAICLAYDLHVALVLVDAVERGHRWNWEISRQWVHPNCRSRGRCLALVRMDNDSRLFAHWCVASSWRFGGRVPLSKKDMEVLQPQNFPPGLQPEITREDLQRHFAEELLPEEDPLPPPEGPWPPGLIPQLYDPANHEDSRITHPLLGVTRVVGVHPPPFPKPDTGNLIPSCTFHRIPEPGVIAESCRSAALVEGFPTAFQRGACRLLGTGGMAWELRPSVLQGMHVSTRHLVYVKMDQVCAMDQRLMASGDYHPDNVGEIVTTGGTYILADPFEMSRPAGNGTVDVFRVYRLIRDVCTYSGALCRAVPLHLDLVQSLTFLHVHTPTFPDPLSVMPSRKAWLRVRFALVAQIAPAELVGILNDIRNQAFEELQAGTLPPSFDPLNCLTLLREEQTRLSRLAIVAGLSPLKNSCA